MRPADDTDAGPSRRTVLAAERTWLAWWRTGIAVSGVAIAVGAVIPRLVEGTRWPYVILGVGYALLAVSIFLMAHLRHREVTKALSEGEDISSGESWIVGLSLGGGLLAFATMIVMVIDG